MGRQLGQGGLGAGCTADEAAAAAADVGDGTDRGAAGVVPGDEGVHRGGIRIPARVAQAA